MTTYNPDSFVILNIVGDKPFYKVLAGWSGGYLYGDSWRLNSGIESHEEDGGFVSFIGSSGSVYSCRIDSERLTMATSGIYNQLIDRGMVELISYAEYKNNIRSDE